jgi:hypothetical protein
MKRAFERRNGMAHPHFEAKASAIFNTPLFRRTTPPVPAPPTTPLDELLTAFRDGDSAAAATLKARRHEPRVRERVWQIAEQIEVPNMAQAELFARLGGPGSRECLERALDAYASSPQTFDKDAPTSWAQQAAVVAGYVLGLTPDHTLAADLLVHLFEHPTPYIRMWSVWVAASIYSHACQPFVGTGPIRTVAMDRILDGVQRVASDGEEEPFIKAIPALACTWNANTTVMLARCEKILSGANVWHRESVINELFQSPYPFRFMPTFWKWFANEPSLRSKIYGAGLLGGALPSASLVDLCRAGLAETSPSMRYRAMMLLDVLDSRQRCVLIAEAVLDEPDPELRAEMKRILRSSKRSTDKRTKRSR